MKNRDGFTLVELIVAMLLLATVAMTIGAATAKLASNTARGAETLTAMDLADDRMHSLQSDPSYTALETRYSATESTLIGFPGLRRTTSITRVTRVLANGRAVDYKVAVVSVTGTGLMQPVIRVATVAAP
jgi:prepilin-type N-terminal cleavage/methylation domain-containing protein